MDNANPDGIWKRRERSSVEFIPAVGWYARNGPPLRRDDGDEGVRPGEKAVMIVEDSFSCFHGESSVVAVSSAEGKHTCDGRDPGVLKTVESRC